MIKYMYDENYHNLYDKYKEIKEKIDAILVGDVTFGDAIDNGNIACSCERLQSAFEYLVDQARGFNFSEELDFLVFETLFYNLVFNAFMFQRYSADSVPTLCISSAADILENGQFRYISQIYDILQFQFTVWLNDRKRIENSDYSKVLNTGYVGAYYDLLLSPTQTENYWNEIKTRATNAHALLPQGELANRMMLISDVQLIYGVGWGDIYDLNNEELVKYLDIRRDINDCSEFIIDCFSDAYERQGNLDWLTGLPHLEATISPVSEQQIIIENEKELEVIKQKTCEYLFEKIMMFPLKIYLPYDQLLTSFVDLMHRSKQLEHTRKKLEKNILELENERNAKHSIINKFSHTAKNMMTTSLQEVAKVLLENEDEDLKNHGRTLLLEYITKRSMQKEIELLQLEFEDNREVFLNKIRCSMSTKNNYVTIQRLLSDAFMRCLITMFYDDSQHGEDMFTGFTESANYVKDLTLLNDQFEMAIRSGYSNDIYTWFINNMKYIHTSFSPSWSELKFEELNYASVLITDLLAELTSNMFKYADKSQEIYYRFEETDDLLIITIRNVATNIIEKAEDGGKGLISYNRSFKQLNRAGRIEGEAIKTEFSSDMQFETTVYLSKEVFQAQ